MADYSQQKDLAFTMITDKGTDIIIRRSSQGTYNPVTEASSGASVRYEAKGAFFEYDIRLIDNTLIKSGDRQVYVAAKGLDIKPTPDKDVIFIEGNAVWNIVSNNPISPSDDDIVYIIQLRR